MGWMHARLFNACRVGSNVGVLRIGSFQPSTPVFLSPIAGYCDLAFRLTVRSLGGVGLASSDLINPRGLLRQTPKSMELVETDPADQPLCIQLYGNEPDEMARAAEWCEENGAAVIDINMGCPVDKVCKRNGGSALLRDAKAAARLAGTVVRAVQAPVTVKMRLGWDDGSIVAPELARALEDAGVAAITVHGRTAEQKFGGSVRLDGIARVVEAVRSIPVIGNGDICSPQDAERMRRVTGCAGVMIGRAALSDPWILREASAWLAGEPLPPPPTPFERLDVMDAHFRRLLAIRGERIGTMIFRQRVSWYCRKLPASRGFKERVRLMTVPSEYWDAVGAYREQLAAGRVERAA